MLTAPQQPKHRHRRENGAVGDEGAEENFIALAPDEADIYNFPNMMSMTMANGPGAGDDGGGGARGDRNVNEANPFNEFRHPPAGRPPAADVDDQLARPTGEKELPELTLDDDDADHGGNDGFGEADTGARAGGGGDGGALRRSFVDAADATDDEDGGNGGEVEEESEDDNAIDGSRFLRPIPSDRGGDGKEEPGASVSRTESDAALLSKSIDFLNSIDGAYLLANAVGSENRAKPGDGRSTGHRTRSQEDDNKISTHKPTPTPDTGENDVFEQMEKKAKSYRLKLYKKHKNFKHTHHHRGGLYHQPYHTFHHDYYRRKMLERERERWKKMQDLKPDYQGQINYYENSNKLETNEDIMAHLNGRSSSSSSQEKWPNFDKVMSSLKTEAKPDNVPPYIKKYNRRNKQLIDLLEGTIAPLSDYSAHKHRERKYHRRKNPHWMEEDLFEEQRPSQPKTQGMQRDYIQEAIQSSTIHSNALPGEGIHIIYDKKHALDGHDDLDDGLGASHVMYGRPTMSSGHGGDGGHPNYKLSSRAGQFVYHRVASPQSPMGGGGYGRLKRQRLPFVAITDRRLSAPPKRRPSGPNGQPSISNSNNGGNHISSNNLLNHQPMP
ncbi:uncharacterized protein LOC128270238 [Anopheles cruzii]|uniref:uncharacterized protein LOC128270238 n=1 Tax=Anopheles cruzii TaxID=68878 RepID=UPI0022EC1AC9|nr:uncharacterized protein LOC128270238 [Anopheles cruzii]